MKRNLAEGEIRQQGGFCATALNQLARFPKTPLKGAPDESLLRELEERVAARDRGQRSAQLGAYFSKVITFEHKDLGEVRPGLHGDTSVNDIPPTAPPLR